MQYIPADNTFNLMLMDAMGSLGAGLGRYRRGQKTQQDFSRVSDWLKSGMIGEYPDVSDPTAQQLLLDAIYRKQQNNPMTSVVQGAKQVSDLVNAGILSPDQGQQLFMRNFGQDWLQAMGGPVREPQFRIVPEGLPYGVSPEQYAEANRAETQRKIKGSSGGRRMISYWDKNGNKKLRLVNDDNFNDVIQSIADSGGKFENDSLSNELSHWQTVLQKTLDPLGDVLPGQEETAQLAADRISVLRTLLGSQGQRNSNSPQSQPVETGLPTGKTDVSQSKSQVVEPENIDQFWKNWLNRLEDENAGLASSDAMENFKKEFIDYATKKLGMTKEQAEEDFALRWIEEREKRGFWRDDVLPDLPGEITKDSIKVYNPAGQLGIIPRKQLKDAIKQGYRLVR